MSRLPISVRLTLAFALAMAVVLAATASFLYLRLGATLEEAIDEGLQVRLSDVSLLAARGEARLTENETDESFAQLLDPRTPGNAVLGAEELARLDSQRVLRIDRREVPGIDGDARLLAGVTETPQGRRVVVVGTSLEDRDEALRGLLGQLVLVGPAALLLASLLGYGIATAALRPVESIRAEAAAISGSEPHRRLTVPAARDEIARLTETLNAMLGRLDSALERERSFIADASHELRTPLAVLKAELELALRRPRSASELDRALRSAAAETDRLVRLAEDLLVLARSDEGQLRLRRDSVSARDLVSVVAERFASDAQEGNRTIESHVPDGLRLSGDQLRLEQALGNLVGNALSHGRGTIRIGCVEGDGSVELHVVDEGPGFPEGFLPRAFERFSRADDARSGAGAGLGLAIVRVIAEAHGGSAHAANRNGTGADVWLALPKRSR